MTGYNIETEAKYSLAVRKELLKAKIYNLILTVGFLIGISELSEILSSERYL